MDFLYFYELIMIIRIRPEVQDLNWPIEWAIVKIVFTFVVSDSMQELTIEYVEIASANIFCIRLELKQIQFCIIRIRIKELFLFFLGPGIDQMIQNCDFPATSKWIKMVL